MARNNRYDDHGLKRDMHDIRERIEDLEDSIVHAARHAGHQAKDRANEMNYKTRRTIREHPVEAIGIAFGTGLLTGLVTRSLLNGRKK
jgi:ElaB/YqjD/DUF883 family membrane-anchored ribosome-binding protein